jgi:hypothetical protein
MCPQNTMGESYPSSAATPCATRRTVASLPLQDGVSPGWADCAARCDWLVAEAG